MESTPLQSELEASCRIELRIKQTCRNPAPANELLPYELDNGIWIRKDASGIYEARIGWGNDFAPPRGWDRENPFADRYAFNYFAGRGLTREIAMRVMFREAKSLWETLWPT